MATEVKKTEKKKVDKKKKSPFSVSEITKKTNTAEHFGKLIAKRRTEAKKTEFLQKVADHRDVKFAEEVKNIAERINKL